MAVKKNVSTKKPVAKKPVAKKATTTKKPATKVTTKKVAEKRVLKPSVTVETKKTNTVQSSYCTTNCKNFMKVLLYVLVILNLAFALFFFFRKDPALKLEELKVGGAENMKKVEQLYNSSLYKDQQTSAIDQFLAGQQ